MESYPVSRVKMYSVKLDAGKLVVRRPQKVCSRCYSDIFLIIYTRESLGNLNKGTMQGDVLKNWTLIICIQYITVFLHHPKIFRKPVNGFENRNISSTNNQCSILWNVTLNYSLIQFSNIIHHQNLFLSVSFQHHFYHVDIKLIVLF